MKFSGFWPAAATRRQAPLTDCNVAETVKSIGRHDRLQTPLSSRSGNTASPSALAEKQADPLQGRAAGL